MKFNGNKSRDSVLIWFENGKRKNNKTEQVMIILGSTCSISLNPINSVMNSKFFFSFRFQPKYVRCVSNTQRQKKQKANQYENYWVSLILALIYIIHMFIIVPVRESSIELLYMIFVFQQKIVTPILQITQLKYVNWARHRSQVTRCAI